MTPATGRPTPNHMRSYMLLVVVMLFWAGNSIVGRAVRDDIPPFTLALLRWTGATILALPFAWRHIVTDRAMLATHWRPMLLLGLAGIAAFNALLYSGLHFTTATNGLLLQAAIPAAVLILNRLIFGQRAAAMQVAGVAISTLGVVHIVLRGHPTALLAMRFNGGDLLILCAVLCWALYTSLLRLRPDVSPWSFLVATFAIGIICMAPLAATEAAAIAAMSWTWRAAGAVAYVAVLPSLIAYLLYNAAVRDLGPARAGQTIALMPLFGSIMAAVLLGETLHGYHLAGMILILGGIVLAASQPSTVRTRAIQSGDE